MMVYMYMIAWGILNKLFWERVQCVAKICDRFAGLSLPISLLRYAATHIQG